MHLLRLLLLWVGRDAFFDVGDDLIVHPEDRGDFSWVLVEAHLRTAALFVWLVAGTHYPQGFSLPSCASQSLAPDLFPRPHIDVLGGVFEDELLDGLITYGFILQGRVWVNEHLLQGERHGAPVVVVVVHEGLRLPLHGVVAVVLGHGRLEMLLLLSRRNGPGSILRLLHRALGTLQQSGGGIDQVVHLGKVRGAQP